MKNAPKSHANKKGYLLKKEDIEMILQQKDGGLDGIRIYFGAEMVDDFMIPTVVIVGCEKDEEGKYNDFDVPEKNLKTLVLKTAASTLRMGKIADVHPCPTVCGTKNILNI